MKRSNSSLLNLTDWFSFITPFSAMVNTKGYSTLSYRVEPDGPETVMHVDKKLVRLHDLKQTYEIIPIFKIWYESFERRSMLITMVR